MLYAYTSDGDGNLRAFVDEGHNWLWRKKKLASSLDATENREFKALEKRVEKAFEAVLRLDTAIDALIEQGAEVADLIVERNRIAQELGLEPRSQEGIT